MAKALSSAQGAALRRLAGDFIPSSISPAASPGTMKSLRARGLVEYGMNVTMGWQLTDQGRAVVADLRNRDTGTHPSGGAS